MVSGFSGSLGGQSLLPGRFWSVRTVLVLVRVRGLVLVLVLVLGGNEAGRVRGRGRVPDIFGFLLRNGGGSFL